MVLNLLENMEFDALNFCAFCQTKHFIINAKNGLVPSFYEFSTSKILDEKIAKNLERVLKNVYGIIMESS